MLIDGGSFIIVTCFSVLLVWVFLSTLETFPVDSLEARTGASLGHSSCGRVLHPTIRNEIW